MSMALNGKSGTLKSRGKLWRTKKHAEGQILSMSLWPTLEGFSAGGQHIWICISDFQWWWRGLMWVQEAGGWRLGELLRVSTLAWQWRWRRGELSEGKPTGFFDWLDGKMESRTILRFLNWTSKWIMSTSPVGACGRRMHQRGKNGGNACGCRVACL